MNRYVMGVILLGLVSTIYSMEKEIPKEKIIKLSPRSFSSSDSSSTSPQTARFKDTQRLSSTSDKFVKKDEKQIEEVRKNFKLKVPKSSKGSTSSEEKK
jgi:hypothetical protein